MIVSFRRTVVVGFFILVLGAGILPAGAQNEDPDTLLKEARRVFSVTAAPIEAEPLFVHITENYRGTSAAFKALAHLGEFGSTRALQSSAYQQMIEDYPGTGAVSAKVSLIRMDYADTKDRAALYRACEQLAVESGGLTLDQILASGMTPETAQKIKLLSFSKKHELLIVYEFWLECVKHGASLETPPYPGDREKALKMAIFLRQNFEPLGIGFDGMSNVHYCLPISSTPPMSAELASPAVNFLSPAAGTQTSPQPTIEARISVGDVTRHQVSLNNLKATLDNGDVKEDINVQLSYGPATVGQTFETIHLKWRPLSPLSPGPHTFTLEVPVEKYPGQGPGKTIATLPFFVVSNPTGPTTQTLPATKDALIDNFDPNGNEGSNSVLALDKLLGRGSRSLVGFDLSGVDTDRLSKATLVLSIHKQEKIFGCGPGEQVSVQALSNTWVEGNGKTYKVLPLTARRRGSGAGATWNRDTDSNIANILANGGYAWNGAQSATMPRTAPMVMARDDMQGTLQFDVTQDVLNGAPHGWLIRKQHENLASRISFYSKEGAVAAGNTELAPKLILEYDGPTASLHPGVAKVASFLGLPTSNAATKPIQLREVVADAERPTLKKALQNHPTVSLIGERLASTVLSHQPLLELGARSAYRSWLQEEAVIGIASLPSRA